MKGEWLLCRFGDAANRAQGIKEESEWKFLWVEADVKSICFFEAENHLTSKSLEGFSKDALKSKIPKMWDRFPSFSDFPDLKGSDEIAQEDPIETIPSKNITIEVAEDEANHVYAFEIVSDQKVVYCVTSTSRRMFEWIFVLKHLSNGIDVSWRNSLLHMEKPSPSKLEVMQRRTSLMALNTQFSQLFSSNMDTGISLSDQARSQWRASIKQIISAQDMTTVFENLMGSSYSKMVAKCGYIMEKEIGQGAFGKVYRVRSQQTGKIFAMKSFEKDSLPIVMEQYSI